MSEMKLTPVEWQEIEGVTILDPDGWRMAGAPAWDEPITRDDFLKRMSISTVQMRPCSL